MLKITNAAYIATQMDTSINRNGNLSEPAPFIDAHSRAPSQLPCASNNIFEETASDVTATQTLSISHTATPTAEKTNVAYIVTQMDTSTGCNGNLSEPAPFIDAHSRASSQLPCASNNTFEETVIDTASDVTATQTLRVTSNAENTNAACIVTKLDTSTGCNGNLSGPAAFIDTYAHASSLPCTSITASDETLPCPICYRLCTKFNLFDHVKECASRLDRPPKIGRGEDQNELPSPKRQKAKCDYCGEIVHHDIDRHVRQCQE